MRVFHVDADRFQELAGPPEALPVNGFVWLASGRREFEVRHAEWQAALQRWNCGQLVDLHVRDLLNHQLPSHFDTTSWYDLMVFRRLAPGSGSQGLFIDEGHGTASSARSALDAIDTSPVGLAGFYHVVGSG
jgi:magnesium transporter